MSRTERVIKKKTGRGENPTGKMSTADRGPARQSGKITDTHGALAYCNSDGECCYMPCLRHTIAIRRAPAPDGPLSNGEKYNGEIRLQRHLMASGVFCVSQIKAAIQKDIRWGGKPVPFWHSYFNYWKVLWILRKKIDEMTSMSSVGYRQFVDWLIEWRWKIVNI